MIRHCRVSRDPYSDDPADFVVWGDNFAILFDGTKVECDAFVRARGLSSHVLVHTTREHAATFSNPRL